MERRAAGLSLDVRVDPDVPPGEIWLVDTDGEVRHKITGLQVPATESRDANQHLAETGTALDGLDRDPARLDIGQLGCDTPRPYFVPLGCDPAHYRPSPKQDVPPKPADAPTPPAFSEWAADEVAITGSAGRFTPPPAPRVHPGAMLSSLRGIMDATEYDTLLTWFGNALMAMYDKGRKAGAGKP